MDAAQEDDDYTISKLFVENIIKLFEEGKHDKNASIGAILVLQSYLAALMHEK